MFSEWLALLVTTVLVATVRPTEALPAIHSYRGVSRYVVTDFNAPHDVPALPNPRENPAFYAKRSSKAYISQGLGPSRPRWADALSSSLSSLLSGIGLDIKVLSHYVLPLAGWQADASVDPISRFTFNSDEVQGILHLDEGATRFDMKGNATIDASPDLPKDSGFDYTTDKVRGVNIGNWLLFELWMDSKLSTALNNHAVNAPGPNSIVDEWTAGLYSTYDWASHVLRKHFDTWITEQDFINIKDAGLNHVRIPFPYWAFAEAKGPDAPYLTLNRFDKLIEACGWARTHGLKVWVDIHGVPGSQNGYDNSGHSGAVHWANKPEYYDNTRYTFNRLSSLFSQPEWKGVVTAIEAVNEPLAMVNEQVRELIRTYYPWARDNAAKPENHTEFTSMLMAMHDGFLGPLYWEGFFTGNAAKRVLLDTHPYFVYSDKQHKEKDTARLREVCAMEDTMSKSQQNYPTIAGEFAVNGPNGDRDADRDLPDGPVDFPDGPDYPFSKKYMAFMARNFAVQTATWDKGAGWIFWAWKNRNARDWSYETGIKYGWLPKNASAPSPFGDDRCADFR